jgi:hypothetical protein
MAKIQFVIGHHLTDCPDHPRLRYLVFSIHWPFIYTRLSNTFCMCLINEELERADISARNAKTDRLLEEIKEALEQCPKLRS